MRRILTWLLWILLIVALAAVVYFVWTQFVSGGDEEEVVGTTVTLVCSSSCKDHGQCGTTVDSPNVEVVLGGLDGPTVEPNTHDRFIPAGAEVEVKETRSERMQRLNGSEYDQQFSRVEWRNTMGDIQKTGWFADWCVDYP